jgi:hypothetical protein
LVISSRFTILLCSRSYSHSLAFNFLQRLVTKNALDAGHKLDIAAAEIVALKGIVTRLQMTVEQEAAQKAAGDKKPGTK